MTNSKMDQVKKLVNAGQYDLARDLVKSMNHPRENDLLKLIADSEGKKKNKSSIGILEIILLMILMIGIGGIGGYIFGQQQVNGSATCPEAQGYYDRVLAVSPSLTDDFVLANDNGDSAARERMMEQIEAVNGLDVPGCAEWASNRFVASNQELVAALNDGEMLRHMVLYSRAVGEGRGYLRALGVEISE